MRLFVDIDGVLARWTVPEVEERLYEKGYFLNLPPNTKIVKAIDNLVKQNFDVYILSKYFEDSTYALREKQEWCQKYIPSIPKDKRIWVGYSENKSDRIPGGIKNDDFLLDDYTPNLKEFTSSGGSGIKYLNGINDTTKSWNGPRIIGFDADKDFYTLSDDIKKVISRELIKISRLRIGSRDFIYYDVSYIDNRNRYIGFFLNKDDISDNDFRNMVLKDRINIFRKMDVMKCSYVLRSIFNDLIFSGRDTFIADGKYVEKKYNKCLEIYPTMNSDDFQKTFNDDITDIVSTPFVNVRKIQKEEIGEYSQIEFNSEIICFFDFYNQKCSEQRACTFRSRYCLEKDEDFLDIATEIEIPEEYFFHKKCEKENNEC